MAAEAIRAALFGVAADNPNLGVCALLHAATAELARRVDGLEPWVFDDGWGVREAEMRLEGGPLRYVSCGARLSKRVHRPESYAHMRVAGVVQRYGVPRLDEVRQLDNPGVAALLSCAAVLDASAGDSFTDIYGPKRLRSVLAPKRLALQLGRPLVLLPQTYGPFREDGARQQAAKVVRKARMAWARDAESHQLLWDLAGKTADSARLRQGVDMAFLLERHRPLAPLDERLAGWLAARAGGEPGARPLVGVNLSGLLHNDPARAAGFGLSFDYRTVMAAVVRRLLDKTDADIVLVDHVRARPGDTGHYDDDRVASAELVAALAPGDRARVARLPDTLTANEVKWVVAQLDWFCGARMHATIGALSSGVPAAAIGYSMKTRAVFETCGVAGEVTEVSGRGDGDIVEQLWDSFTRRDEVRATLATTVPRVRRAAGEQMDVIAGLIADEHRALVRA